MSEKSIEQIYKDVFDMIGAILNKKSEATIIKAFNDQLIKTGKFPPRLLDNLKEIVATKKDVEKLKYIFRNVDSVSASSVRIS